MEAGLNSEEKRSCAGARPHAGQTGSITFKLPWPHQSLLQSRLANVVAVDGNVP
ncbi:hypothetical protein DUNSADRAFT_14941 [Dunaliella salina]|uniref:Encoded protein n=1 Tax=Dunaliella salina TaxID=3046 RepID=A0ABQ7G6C4_DUNSA|nr:hypothetical protein DUNSADRAFT_14941 [Dunaliella salina]|eukprot:KAF5830164.1 hypothetical protein DUNSADRAFT_14941 [Dunaliella salina]